MECWKFNAARIKSGIISALGSPDFRWMRQMDISIARINIETISMCLQYFVDSMSETDNGTPILEYNTWFGTMFVNYMRLHGVFLLADFQIFIYRAFANINVSHDRNNILDTHRMFHILRYTYEFIFESIFS